jgi:hypothetical protein
LNCAKNSSNLRGGRGRGGNFHNSPYKPNNQVDPRTPINLITNNFKIQSQNNHSGIIYTYSVDFIDGENIENLAQMPPPTDMVAIEAEKPVSDAATN